MKSVTRKLVFALVLTQLIGCPLRPAEENPQPTLGVSEREAELKAFNEWRANGSITLESEKEGKFNASFSWDTDKEGFDIKLFGPLGVQAFQLIQRPDGAELIDRDGQSSRGDAEELLLAASGYAMPITKMQSWAVGLAGDAANVQRDQSGRLKSMEVEENGTTWNIDFERYRRVDDLDLPRTIQIDGDGVNIRLSFRRWIQSEKPASDRLSIPGVSS